MKSSTNGASRRRARQNGRVDDVGGGAVESMKKQSNQNTRARFRQEFSRLLRAADRRDGGPMSAATGAMSVQPVLRVAETCWCAPEQLAWV